MVFLTRLFWVQIFLSWYITTFTVHIHTYDSTKVGSWNSCFHLERKKLISPKVYNLLILHFSKLGIIFLQYFFSSFSFIKFLICWVFLVLVSTSTSFTTSWLLFSLLILQIIHGPNPSASCGNTKYSTPSAYIYEDKSEKNLYVVHVMQHY